MMNRQENRNRGGVLPHWRYFAGFIILSVLTNTLSIIADDSTVDELTVPSQPLLTQVHRLVEALDVVGRPVDKETLARIATIKSLDSDQQVVAAIQKTLDPLCLAVVDIQPSGPAKVTSGSAARKLLEQGWRTFLIKVINRPGRTGRMFVESPNAQPLPHALANQIESRWMQVSSFDGQPMRANLSGLALEYRIVQIYSRDAGRKSAVLEFNVSGDPKGDRDLIREWRFDKNSDGWRAMNQISLNVRDNSLQIESTGEDPFMGAEVEHRGGPMVLRFWAHTEADGKHSVSESSWVAVRVFPHAHTNPIYVVVNEKPVRGSVDSARWCLAGVEQCWTSKQNTYEADEQADARAAYDHALKTYGQLIREAGNE